MTKDRDVLHAALDSLLASYSEETLITEYASGEALLADIKNNTLQPTLLFLDIFMDGISGLETAHQLRTFGCQMPIVFLTSSPDFAVESYDVEAAGYLLKPLRLDKLQKLVERLLGPAERKQVLLHCGRTTECVYLDAITYVESSAYMLKVHLADKHTLEMREKLDTLESKLSDRRFLRCHQSYLVNMDYIVDDKNDFLLTDGTRVPIRVRSRKQNVDSYRRYYLSKF